MKVGDLVKLKSDIYGELDPGIAVDFIDKKCWRTEELGPTVDWSAVDPEKHAIVLVDGSTLTVPVSDLEVWVAKNKTK